MFSGKDMQEMEELKRQGLLVNLNLKASEIVSHSEPYYGDFAPAPTTSLLRDDTAPDKTLRCLTKMAFERTIASEISASHRETNMIRRLVPTYRIGK